MDCSKYVYILMSGYIHILDDIGFFAPMILFTLSIIVLWSHIKYLNVYLIFFFLNMLLNKNLKPGREGKILKI